MTSLAVLCAISGVILCYGSWRTLYTPLPQYAGARAPRHRLLAEICLLAGIALLIASIALAGVQEYREYMNP